MFSTLTGIATLLLMAEQAGDETDTALIVEARDGIEPPNKALHSPSRFLLGSAPLLEKYALIESRKLYRGSCKKRVADN
jgi:hypothetical protein